MMEDGGLRLSSRAGRPASITSCYTQSNEMADGTLGRDQRAAVEKF
jgi:hypothetical protein